MFKSCIDSSTTHLGSSASSNKRQLCGTISAVIASCVSNNDGTSSAEGRPDVAKSMFELCMDKADKLSLSADLVTYCCACAGTRSSHLLGQVQLQNTLQITRSGAI